jgi:hypothetical protein
MKYTFHIVDVFSSTPFAVINSIEPRRQLWNVNGVLIQDAITGTVTALSNAEFGQTARRSVAPSGVERAILHEVDK